MKSPCIKDCSNRAVGCRRTCEKWQKYEKEYFKNIEEKRIAGEVTSDYVNFRRKSKEKMLRRLGVKR